MDTLIYQKLWAWAKRRHPNKKPRWVAYKYWLSGGNGWRFGKKGVAALHQMSDIPIRRHIVVQKHRSPYDGDAIYWSTRMGRHPEVPWSFARLLKQQRGRCPHCGLFFKHGDQMIVQRSRGWTQGQIGKAMLLHEHC